VIEESGFDILVLVLGAGVLGRRVVVGRFRFRVLDVEQLSVAVREIKSSNSDLAR
jgi:hypothetical protein